MSECTATRAPVLFAGQPRWDVVAVTERQASRRLAFVLVRSRTERVLFVPEREAVV
jgi:hypothetical protein